MAGVIFPLGIGKAALNVPRLDDLSPPSPPAGPLPIPYPNTAHFQPIVPPALVLNELFGHSDIEVLGLAPPTYDWLT